MSVPLKRLLLPLVVLAATLAVPATAASAAPEPAACKSKATCADKGLRVAPSDASARTATDVGTTAIQVPPPAGYPPGTPCYYEEVVEYVYETGRGALMYEFEQSGFVCLLPNSTILYSPDTSVNYPNYTPDPRLRVEYFVRNEIVTLPNPTEKDVFSELRVTFCPNPAQPSTCQRYLHRLGLAFTSAYVFPYSVFERMSS